MKLIASMLIIIAAQSCGGEETAPPEHFPTQKEVNRSMEDINRKFMLDEAMMIDSYIERRQLSMKSTGTGLRYEIDSLGAGRLAENGQRAVVSYNIELLNGNSIYSSEKDGNKEFLIGQDHVESGLHEGIIMMRIGDKAKFILPSHLAHGLSGDNNKIPPRSSVVYDIELLELR